MNLDHWILFMCGGIAFKISSIPKSELLRVYGEEKSALLLKKGQAESHYWDKHPVLPVRFNGKNSLMDWGNREKEIPLPKTGWAKKESLEKGKWNYLHPKQAVIFADRGFEKGVWFDIRSSKIDAIVVDRGNIQRAYMVTEPANQDYIKMTGHNRQPVVVER